MTVGKHVELLVNRRPGVETSPTSEAGAERVSPFNPFPVSVEGVALALGSTFSTDTALVPVTTQGTLYTSGDAVGGKFSLAVPPSGIIQSVIYYDVAALVTAKELWVFNRDFAAVADNAAFSVSDTDIMSSEGVIAIPAANFFASALNAIGRVDALAKSYSAPSGRLWMQIVTRSADTIAAGQPGPFVALRIIPDALTYVPPVLS